MSATKPHLTVKLAAPRGFCAGVVRAIDIVELALKKYGPPVYVRHEIVHNRFVVEGLEAKGAIFIDELIEAPDDRPVIFSAHGVPKSVPAEAQRRNLHFVDATCPLVSKVHREAERAHGAGKRVILIGHDGHPEVIGTLGQLPGDAVTLIEHPEDVARIEAEHIAVHRALLVRKWKIPEFPDETNPEMIVKASKWSDLYLDQAPLARGGGSAGCTGASLATSRGHQLVTEPPYNFGVAVVA